MRVLVADVGGTNSRLAMAAVAGPVPATIRHFENAAYASFYDLVRVYLRDEAPGAVDIFSVAMAGPVSSGRGQLTNRDWEISEPDLKQAAGCDRAFLMNDLTALGYGLGHLPGDGVAALCGAPDPALQNGQALVVGVGTGFNVCPVKITRTGESCCFEAEAGHTGLPAPVSSRLILALQNKVTGFGAVEDLFSGRGLARLGSLLSGVEGRTARDIVEAYANTRDPDAAETLTLYAELLGGLCKELVLQYMPRNGIYLAGSVARGVFSAGFHDEFALAFQNNPQPDPTLGSVPVSVILDDAAALTGCAAAAG